MRVDRDGEANDQPTTSVLSARSETRQIVLGLARAAGAKAAPAVKGTASKTPRAVNKAATTTARTSLDLLKQGVSAVTFGKFRHAVESAMTDLVSVVAAQSAEIRHLRRRIEELERER